MSSTLPSHYLPPERARMPVLTRWIALSLLLHAALLAWSPRSRMMTSDEKPDPPSMTVFLQPKPQQAAPASPKAPPPAPQVAKPAPRATLKPVPPRESKAREPVIALAKPSPRVPSAPSVPSPPAETSPTPPQVTSPPAEDLAAFIEARRRARGEGADTPALASAAPKPSASLNLESPKPTASGGLFQIRHRGYDYAEFIFFGWNENFRRNGLQLIEVRKGNNSDIDIAVIRKMIEIIRDYERGDFKWYSKRTGKTLTLSARARDNSGLEEFMMQEFREELHRYQ